MGAVTLSISGMSCGHCVAAVRAALEELPDVRVRDVRIGSAEVLVGGAGTPTAVDAVLEAVRDAGYEATVAGAGEAPAADGGGPTPDLTTLGRRTTT